MTDAIIDNQPLTRSTDLPAEEVQQQESQGAQADLHALLLQPGWKIVEERLQSWYESYHSPQFSPDMPYEEIGKEYLLSQQMAQMIKEVLDDIKRAP